MKKLIAAGIATFALLALTPAVFAGAKNSTFVKFTAGSNTYLSYWMTTGSGLIHEWRFDENEYDLHFVFKPAVKFDYADCDTDNLWFSYENWSFSNSTYGEINDDSDQGDLKDFITPSTNYRVCAYRTPVQ